MYYLCIVKQIKRGALDKRRNKKMKTFEFSKQTKEKVVKAFNNSYFGVNHKIDDVMALSTVQKCYGLKCKIHIFKTYIDNLYYAMYEDGNRVIGFGFEKDVYEFIFGL